jgi:hypothetical protein
MNLLPVLRRQRFEFPCTVEVEHTQESLHAHLTIDADFEIEPGDEVRVNNAPTLVPFGERVVAQTTAVIVRASAIERAWTRWIGNFELTELYDVSFTERRML